MVPITAKALQAVAPVRERGLKSCGQCLGCRLDSRSRKGAWIEMSLIGGALSNSAGRSRKGAWIEIAATGLYGTSGLESLP